MPVPSPSRVELYAAIRRDTRQGMSGREVQRKHGVGWHTVQAALASAWPVQRAPYPARASKLDPYKPIIDEILIADLDAPRKQRHTVTRIFDRLCSEHGMTDVSYPVVRAYVADGNPTSASKSVVPRPLRSYHKLISRGARPRSTSVRSACAYEGS